MVGHGPARRGGDVTDKRRIAPRRVVDSGPGAGDVFASEPVVALARGDKLEAALSEASQAALDSLA